jgi:hypothetical protein
MASRQHSDERREIDWERIPFQNRRVPSRVLDGREALFLEVAYAVCLFSRDNPALVDSDVQASLQALAETYQTLTSGILYEKPPGHRLQRELYQAFMAAVARYKEQDAGQVMVARESLLDGDVRDALIFLTQLSALRSNGRPKGRAFIDSLRSQFKRGAFERPPYALIVAP